MVGKTTVAFNEGGSVLTNEKEFKERTREEKNWGKENKRLGREKEK